MPSVQPNEYSLSGAGLSVVYQTSGPSLEYVGPGGGFVPESQTLVFSAPEITTEAVAIGTLVSVPIFRTIDTGATLFSIVIPVIELADASKTQPFTTFGVYTRTKGPDSFPRTGVREFYSTVVLTGVASVRQPHFVPLYAAPIHQAVASGELLQMKRLAAQAASVKNPTPEITSALAALKAAIASSGG